MSFDQGIDPFGSNNREPGFVSNHVWEFPPRPSRKSTVTETDIKRMTAREFQKLDDGETKYPEGFDKDGFVESLSFPDASDECLGG